VTVSIPLEPISAEAFAPFGLLLRAPAVGGPRLDLIDDLQNTRSTAKPRLSLGMARPRGLPLTATQMERHVHSSQTFIPQDCSSYFVMVAPHGADGAPDVAGIRAFRVPGDVGVHYFADIWHHPLTTLERPGSFVVLTFVDGGPGDEQFVDLPETVEVGE
jgi:ureidoglycolate lyase